MVAADIADYSQVGRKQKHRSSDPVGVSSIVVPYLCDGFLEHGRYASNPNYLDSLYRQEQFAMWTSRGKKLRGGMEGEECGMEEEHLIPSILFPSSSYNYSISCCFFFIVYHYLFSSLHCVLLLYDVNIWLFLIIFKLSFVEYIFILFYSFFSIFYLCIFIAIIYWPPS